MRQNETRKRIANQVLLWSKEIEELHSAALKETASSTISEKIGTMKALITAIEFLGELLR